MSAIAMKRKDLRQMPKISLELVFQIVYECKNQGPVLAGFALFKQLPEQGGLSGSRTRNNHSLSRAGAENRLHGGPSFLF